MSRTFRVTKTRQGKPKVTLYEQGQVMLSRPVASALAGNRLGVAWAGSERKSAS